MENGQSQGPRVFLDLNHGTEPFGRLVIELLPDKAPRACENFLALCTSDPSTSKSYRLTPFHRLIPDFILQGGDILNRDGTGRYSIFPGHSTFDDEPASYRIVDAPGLLCLANSGKGTHSNSSQFYISLAASDQTTASIFGRLIQGLDLLPNIDRLAIDSTDRPVTDLLIANCGLLSNPTSKSATSPRRGRERIRPSRSPISPQADPHHCRPPLKHNGSHRHSSLDPTQRGRIRRRSSSPSPSGAASPPPKKRPALENHRRSPSLSRSVTPSAPGEKRRRRMRTRSREGRHPYEREDEALIRRLELERDGGEGRFDGVIATDEDDAYGRRDGEERGRRDGRDEKGYVRSDRERDRSDHHRSRYDDRREGAGNGEVKFKGRGRMNYRERGEFGAGGGQGNWDRYRR